MGKNHCLKNTDLINKHSDGTSLISRWILKSKILNVDFPTKHAVYICLPKGIQRFVDQRLEEGPVYFRLHRHFLLFRCQKVIFSLPNKRRWNAYLSKHWVDPYYSWFIDQKLPNIYRWCLDQDESGWKSHHLLWHFSDWNITRSRLGLLGLDRLGSNTMRDQASGPQGRQAFFKAKIWEKMWQFHADIWEYLARNLRIWMDLRWFKMISAL